MKSGNDCVIWQEYNKPESILYGDGRRARMEYTPLGQLAMVKDWLGETRIERDSYGAPVCITDHKGRSVHYEWGGMGQRQGMEAEYFYNALGHRTGQSIGGEMEEYLLNLTKPYHNLMELRKGKHQPFGYTGYRYDDISGTYFAQAREYQPEVGRFVAEDVARGNGADPKILNHYGYCLDNPIFWVDLNGLYPEWLYGIFAHLQFEWEFAILYDENYGSMSTDDVYGCSNVYIPKGGRNKGAGFADVVLYNKADTEIYEIKPQSYYDDSTKRKSGESQLQRYIDTYNKNNKTTSAKHGKMEDIETILFIESDYVFDKNMTIIYRMYDDSPGMIYYEFHNKNQQKEYGIEEFQVQTELDEEIEKMLLIMAMSSAVSGATILEIGEVITNGFFLLIPQIQLDMFKQQMTGNCLAQV